MKDDKLMNLFDTMELLARPQGASPSEVSEMLGFDRHTFYKMIKTLDAINVPYDKRPDITGPTNSMRYYIRKDYLQSEGPKVLRLSHTEFFLLKYLLRKGTLFHGSSIEPIIDSLKQKLDKLTFSDTKGSSPAIFITDNHRRNYSDVQQEIFSHIMNAIETQTELAVTYTAAPNENNIRTNKQFRIQPYTFLDHNGAFYVLAKNPEGKAILIYALERFSEATPVEKTHFKIPDDFSPAEYLKGSFGLSNEKKPIHIKLLLEWTAWSAITDRIWGENQSLKKQEDGSFILEFDTRPGIELEAWIRGFGSDVQILEPQSLVDSYRQDLKKLIEMYGI